MNSNQSNRCQAFNNRKNLKDFVKLRASRCVNKVKMARWRRRSVQWRKKKRVFQLLVISASSQRHTCAQLQSELWVSWRHPFAPFFGPQRKIFILRPLNVSMLFFGCLTRAKTWTRMLLACSPRLPWRPPPAIGASPESAGWQRHLVGVLLSDVWPVNLFPARHPTKKK